MNTKDIVRDFFSSELLPGTREKVIGDDDQLIESGIIDSLGIMSLLAFVEEKFSIEITGEDLIPENFSSISAITALVERQVAR